MLAPGDGLDVAGPERPATAGNFRGKVEIEAGVLGIEPLAVLDEGLEDEVAEFLTPFVGVFHRGVIADLAAAQMQGEGFVVLTLKGEEVGKQRPEVMVPAVPEGGFPDGLLLLVVTPGGEDGRIRVPGLAIYEAVAILNLEGLASFGGNDGFLPGGEQAATDALPWW